MTLMRTKQVLIAIEKGVTMSSVLARFGTYDPVEHLGAAAPCFMDYTDDGAVYQHNQTDLEFLAAAPHGPAVREPSRMSFELMFDGVAARAIKGSLVNINLVSPTSPTDVRWEGPELDA